MREERLSTCALDCPDACSVLVTVEDGRATRLRGDPRHPVTQGFLCGKVTKYLEREYHPGRLLYPMRRAGAKGEGRFTRVSWDEALDEIAERLQQVATEFGSEAILPYSYAGTMGYLQGSGMDRRFFHRLGVSRLDRTICASAGSAALNEVYGARYGMDPEEFAHAKLVLIWGANIHATNVHLWPFLVEARRRGARLVAIDPVRTRTAELSDRWLAPYPGSDLALALGLLHVIFRDGLADLEYLNSYATGVEDLQARAAEFEPQRVENLTGLPAADVEWLARTYATTAGSAIRVNYGVQRSERGGRAMHAISLLPVVTGQWKHRGGGLLLSTSGAFAVNRVALEMPELQQVSLGREARLVNMSALAHALNDLQDPPVKAMVVYNSNPAAIAPAQHRVLAGLRRDDLFTVVLEQFQTDTADYADFLLPATTFLEHTDLYFAYGHYYLQLARPVVAPPGECRSNSEVFRALAKRIGFTEPCFDETDDEMIRGLLRTNSPFLEGITLERLEREHSVRLNVAPYGEPFRPFAQGGFCTSSGKCDVSGTKLAYTPPDESRLGANAQPAYPLELVSSKSHDSMNSTFGHRDEVDAQTAVLRMHPLDAALRGLLDGDPVAVYNARGQVRLRCQVSDGVRPGVVHAPSVRWNKRNPDGHGINVLTQEKLTDIGGGPTFYNCLVEVRKCEN